jgi:hypothetical protein
MTRAHFRAPRLHSLTHAAPCPPSPARAPAGKKTIKVTFVKPDGSKQVVDAPIGDSMLEVAHANKIDIEGASGKRAAGAGAAEDVSARPAARACHRLHARTGGAWLAHE